VNVQKGRDESKARQRPTLVSPINADQRSRRRTAVEGEALAAEGTLAADGSADSSFNAFPSSRERWVVVPSGFCVIQLLTSVVSDPQESRCAVTWLSEFLHQ
jgi:hypothetical protein